MHKKAEEFHGQKEIVYSKKTWRFKLVFLKVQLAGQSNGPLKLVTRKRKEVHRLNENHDLNSVKLLKLIKRYRPEYIVTLDEALVYLTNSGIMKVCYLKKGEEIPEEYLERDKENYSHFIVVAAMSGRGVCIYLLPLIKVPSNVKYYVEKVLKLLLEKELPKLYSNDLDKILVDHDLAPAHRAKLTQEYAKDLRSRLGITMIHSSDIPVKLPDASPIDFFRIFGSEEFSQKKGYQKFKSCFLLL